MKYAVHEGPDDKSQVIAIVDAPSGMRDGHEIVIPEGSTDLPPGTELRYSATTMRLHVTALGAASNTNRGTRAAMKEQPTMNTHKNHASTSTLTLTPADEEAIAMLARTFQISEDEARENYIESKKRQAALAAEQYR